MTLAMKHIKFFVLRLQRMEHFKWRPFRFEALAIFLGSWSETATLRRA